ncbi:5HT3A protein, partial [Polypterus senegalus]
MAHAEISYDMGVFMKFYHKFQHILEMPKMRPSSNWTVPTNINISVTFHHILGVLWFNDYLVWKPEEFDGIDHLIVPLDFIWIPDFYIWEFVGENFSPLMSYAYIHHTGKVICDQPIRAETSCYLDIFFFPFDTQKCSFTFGPYLHTGGYFLFCLALLVISLLESIFISYILNGLGAQNRTVPQWVKSFVLGYMSQLICYKITDTREHHKKMNVFTVGMFKSYEGTYIRSYFTFTAQALRGFISLSCQSRECRLVA